MSDARRDGDLPLGATARPDGSASFCVWAPRAARVEVRLLDPPERLVPLAPAADGYHWGVVAAVPPGSRYRYRLDGDLERSDPASRAQPEGVHGPSAVLDPRHEWRHPAPRRPLRDYVLYELHVGTFTAGRTFAAAAARLDDLVALGVTAIEIMPVATFPGARNWGYDGTYLFAVHPAYGGAAGLKAFVDECHGRGLSVVLDVVFNHLGPEGNYLAAYGPYFTDRYRTPWGDAVNFDGAGSDEVRRYFVACALEYLTDYRVDALRLDATHAIVDTSARPFLEELGAAVRARGRELGRELLVIAESDRNDPRLALPVAAGGLGLDAIWNDDFHHALHTLLTGEERGYYVDFGRIEQLARAYQDGFVYTGERSRFRGRRHGRPATALAPHQLVVCAQNHDQVGNRMRGDRLATLVDFERQKLAAAAVLLAPQVPLLFMGEEYGETAPFPYFVSHGDPDLLAAVRHGRAAEFAGFQAEGEPPDPGAEATFASATLDPPRHREGRHALLWELHRELLRLRREWSEERPGASGAPAASGAPEVVTATPLGEAAALIVVRTAGPRRRALVLNFGASAVAAALPTGRWRRRLDTAATAWGGPGSAAADPAGPPLATVAATSAALFDAAEA